MSNNLKTFDEYQIEINRAISSLRRTWFDFEIPNEIGDLIFKEYEKSHLVERLFCTRRPVCDIIITFKRD